MSAGKKKFIISGGDGNKKTYLREDIIDVTHPAPWKIEIDGLAKSIVDANGEYVMEDTWDGYICNDPKLLDRIVNAVNSAEGK